MLLRVHPLSIYKVQYPIHTKTIYLHLIGHKFTFWSCDIFPLARKSCVLIFIFIHNNFRLNHETCKDNYGHIRYILLSLKWSKMVISPLFSKKKAFWCYLYPKISNSLQLPWSVIKACMPWKLDIFMSHQQPYHFWKSKSLLFIEKKGELIYNNILRKKKERKRWTTALTSDHSPPPP